ncbi:MAG TPA: acyl carrier protein [Pyrinomonadaceae bacterium]|nr:acyl carrier protein [Pyrinomonadaceae bacterium]
MDEKELREMICDKFLGGDRDFPLGADTRLLEEGICDSLGLVQIVAELEGRVPSLRIPDQDVTRENFGSIAAILDYVSRRRAA